MSLKPLYLRQMAALALLLVLITVKPAIAGVNGIAAPQVASAPILSGSASDISEASWSKALHAKNFVSFSDRKSGGPATDVWFLMSKAHMYIVFIADQPGLPITANVKTNNLDVTNDDYATFDIATSGNSAHQYFFEANPSGIRSQSSTDSSRYEPAWRAVGGRTDKGWFVEMDIPLSALQLSPSSPQVWRLNFARYIATTQKLYTWAYSPSMQSPFDPSYWPSMNGVKVDTGLRSPAVDVFALDSGGGDAGKFVLPSSALAQERERHFGLDALVPITGSLSFVSTLNPDYSNVENDQFTIAPQEFARQLVDARSFFAEGSSFLPGTLLFYSPSIGVFNEGEKVEGSVGPYRLGALAVQGFGLDDQVLKTAYASKDQSFQVALAAVNANHNDLHDSAYGLSANYTNLTSRIGASASYVADSGTRVLDNRYATGSTVGLSLSRADVQASVSFQSLGPYYAPADAFVRVNDIKGPAASFSLTNPHDLSGSVRSYAIQATGDRFTDQSNAVHLADSNASGSVTFKNFVGISLGGSWSEFRQYSIPFPTYSTPQTLSYDQTTIGSSYRLSVGSTANLSYSWGPYGGSYLQQVNGSFTRQLNHVTVGLTFGEATEHGQFGQSTSVLERFLFSDNFGRYDHLDLNARLSGQEAFQGADFMRNGNLAMAYRHQFHDRADLYVEYGSPNSPSTLHRAIVKLVYHVGQKR